MRLASCIIMTSHNAMENDMFTITKRPVNSYALHDMIAQRRALRIDALPIDERDAERARRRANRKRNKEAQS